MADEQRHEWPAFPRPGIETAKVFFVAADGDTNAAEGELIAQILRLAARERELLALTGKQHAYLKGAETSWTETAPGPRCLDCGVGYDFDLERQPHSETCELAALLASPDAQKAAGKLESLRADVMRLREENGFMLLRIDELRAQRDRREKEIAAAVEVQRRLNAKTDSLEADNEALRAEVQETHALAMQYELMNDRLRARLSKLDQMLASESAPFDLFLATDHLGGPPRGQILQAAWRWFREALGAPVYVGVDLASGQDFTVEHVVAARPAEPQEEGRCHATEPGNSATCPLDGDECDEVCPVRFGLAPPEPPCGGRTGAELADPMLPPSPAEIGPQNGAGGPGKAAEEHPEEAPR